jgi:hypothetical protein
VRRYPLQCLSKRASKTNREGPLTHERHDTLTDGYATIPAGVARGAKQMLYLGKLYDCFTGNPHNRLHFAFFRIPPSNHPRTLQ